MNTQRLPCLLVALLSGAVEEAALQADADVPGRKMLESFRDEFEIRGRMISGSRPDAHAPSPPHFPFVLRNGRIFTISSWVDSFEEAEQQRQAPVVLQRSSGRRVALPWSMCQLRQLDRNALHNGQRFCLFIHIIQSS
jgi:hypothetical protein